MRVMIIDCQDTRRDLIETWLRSEGHEAISYAHRDDIDMSAQSPDILLLHIGVNQEGQYGPERRRDAVKDILAELSATVWTIGYSGGAIAEAAMHGDYSKYARYRPQVAGDEFPRNMRNVIFKSLEGIASSRQLDEQSFKSLVTGFDLILEYKLESLVSVLRDGTIDDDVIQELINSLSDTVDLEDERLPVIPSERVAFAKGLRDKFFGGRQ
jgi:hypothetical protein